MFPILILQSYSLLSDVQVFNTVINMLCNLFREANGQEAVSKKANDSVKDTSKSRKKIEAS